MDRAQALDGALMLRGTARSAADARLSAVARHRRAARTGDRPLACAVANLECARDGLAGADVRRAHGLGCRVRRAGGRQALAARGTADSDRAVAQGLHRKLGSASRLPGAVRPAAAARIFKEMRWSPTRSARRGDRAHDARQWCQSGVVRRHRAVAARRAAERQQSRGGADRAYHERCLAAS